MPVVRVDSKQDFIRRFKSVSNTNSCCNKSSAVCAKSSHGDTSPATDTAALPGRISISGFFAYSAGINADIVLKIRYGLTFRSVLFLAKSTASRQVVNSLCCFSAFFSARPTRLSHFFSSALPPPLPSVKFIRPPLNISIISPF